MNTPYAWEAAQLRCDVSDCPRNQDGKCTTIAIPGEKGYYALKPGICAHKRFIDGLNARKGP